MTAHGPFKPTPLLLITLTCALASAGWLLFAGPVEASSPGDTWTQDCSPLG